MFSKTELIWVVTATHDSRVFHYFIINYSSNIHTGTTCRTKCMLDTELVHLVLLLCCGLFIVQVRTYSHGMVVCGCRSTKNLSC